MKFYFTYGTDSGYPFQGGWTEINAPSMDKACAAFRVYHPDRTPGLVNCAAIYGELAFRTIRMDITGNFGAYCHEVITLEREVKTN